MLRRPTRREGEEEVPTPRRLPLYKSKSSSRQLDAYPAAMLEDLERVPLKSVAAAALLDWKTRRGLATAIVGLTLIVAALWLFWNRDAGPPPSRSFVSVTGLNFIQDCRPFYIVGFNAHDAVTAARLTPSEYRMAGGRSGKGHVRKMFQEAAAMGLNVARVWVHSDDAQFPFQIEPGRYDEKGFRALDYVIDEARKQNIKLILSLIDSWKYYNGVDQFIDWSSTAPERTHLRPNDEWGDPRTVESPDEARKYEVRRRALFFSDPSCRELYKEHLIAIAQRINTLNGQRYLEDPTIMAWDLINEPRCETWLVPECDQSLQEWVGEMSGFLKGLDPNHLITIGSEGFFGRNSTMQHLNPQPWAADLGQDFIKNHAIDTIDFATIHVWPDHWQKTGTQFGQEWIESHIKVATEVLKKPFLIEEFGKKLTDDTPIADQIEHLRNPVFHSTYQLVEGAIQQNTAMAGSLFWRWTLPMFHGADAGEYGVSLGDPTSALVEAHVAAVLHWMRLFPPCVHQCWLAHSTSMTRSCRNLPEMCATYLKRSGASDQALLGRPNEQDVTQIANASTALGRMEMYASKEECCQPGTGAFSHGCAWWPLRLLQA